MSEFKKVNRAKRWISLLLIAAMSFSLFGTVAASTQKASDIDGHWAAESIHKWVNNGFLQGYEDGSYKPDRQVTRAEFVSLINRSFKLTEKAELSFGDVDKKSWMYDQVSIAVKAGYVNGFSDGSFRPSQIVTREQAAIMVSKLLAIKPTSIENVLTFTDSAKISKSSKEAVAALVQEKIIKGLPNGSFNPQGGLSRAQGVTLLDAALAFKIPTTTYDKAGIYGNGTVTETVYGNVVISAPGVTLQNMTIKGNVTLTAAVGEGDVYFKKVKIEGETIIQGGGPNSVHFEDSVLVRITVDKKDGSVRVVVVGASSIQHVVVNSSVKLEESNVTDSGFANIQLAAGLPPGSQVDLIGRFENVDVLSSNIKVNFPSGTINNLNVQADSANNKIYLSKDATVIKLILDAVASIVGQGNVENATVGKDAAGSTFETKPKKVEGAGSGTTTPTPTTITIGGGGPGPISTPAPTPTPTSTPEPTAIPEPTPTTVPCTSEGCNKSLVEEITVGDLTLNHLDSNRTNTGGEDFDPNVYAYSIVTDRDMQRITVPLSVTKSTYTTVSYGIQEGLEGFYTFGSIDKDSIEIPINPMKDTQILINATSGDGKDTKQYQIYIQYPRTIQEGFKVMRQPSYNHMDSTWSYNYSLVSGTINGEKLKDTDVIKVYRNQGDTDVISSQCTASHCTIPNEELNNGTANFYIQIYRGGTILTEGTYKYDGSPLTQLTGDIGVEVDILDKQQLIDHYVTNPFSSSPYSHAILTYVDHTKLFSAVPKVTYITTGFEFISNKSSDLPAHIESDHVKLRVNALGYPTVSYSSANYIDSVDNGQDTRRQIGGVLFHQGENKDVHDMFYYVILYDASYNPIGYYIDVITFDEDHVADGYTPTNHWQPAP